MKTKVLVAGCSGFMGMNISEALLETNKFEVYGVAKQLNRVPKNMNVDNIFKCDLTNWLEVNSIINKICPDIVIQAAATTSGVKDILNKPYIHVTDNAIMNSLLLRECYEQNVKHFIFLSCGVMYQPGEIPRKETDYNESDEIYHSYFGVGWTKVYIEKMMEFYSKLNRTKHTVIRHSNTIGPYDKYGKEESHMFSANIHKVMTANDGDIIEVWGTGEETERDLIYVDDVCDFIIKCIEKQSDPYKLYNVGYGKSYTVKHIVENIINISGKKLSITYNENKPVIATKLSLDCEKALLEIGWFPKVSLSDGIRNTIKWYRKNMLGENNEK